MSKNYKTVQPIEVLDFFKDMVGTVAELETAGVLYGGKQYWTLARLQGELNLAGDITKPYLLLSTSADGSLATQARLTTVRVVCNNTLSAAARGRADVVVRHSSKFDASAVHARIGELYTSLGAHYETMRTLAKIKLDQDKAQSVLTQLAGTDEMPNGFKRVMALFNGAGMGAESEAAKGTAFGLVQAFTQFADWEVGRSKDSRLFNSWFGRTDKLKTDLVELLTVA